MDAQCQNCPNSAEGVVCYNLPSCRPIRRRHKLPSGQCKSCDRETSDFHPPHDASPRCESGKRSHCSCDTCF